MTEQVLYVGLPYVAIVLFIGGTAWRYAAQRYSISSLSSQFLEDRWLGVGSLPWHLGILVVLAGHLVAFAFPTVWRSVLSVPVFLHTVEIVGLAAAVACALGIGTLLVRRVLRGRLQPVTTWLDYLVLVLLLAEVSLGILTATAHRWGALWSTGTIMPFVKSLLTLQPKLELVSELPPLARAHLVVAFVLFGIAPFTRLIHAVFVPLQYLFRAPQRVVWSSERRKQAVDAEPGGDPDLARRHLIEGVVGATAAAALLGVGVADKVAGYFVQPALTKVDKKNLLTERHLRVMMTAEERALELERLSNDFILISPYSELSKKNGRYFIDYEMRPALAFLGDDGIPIVLSAKCTHLGCTVGKDVDDQGRILCPCHVSHFDVRSGHPNQSAPAKAPLPKLPWAARDAAGKVVGAMGIDGKYVGSRDTALLSRCNVYAAKSALTEVT
ncbi:MAG: respiratory nitrate reductase subunit gamma [Myxococcales bacterium]